MLKQQLDCLIPRRLHAAILFLLLGAHSADIFAQTPPAAGQLSPAEAQRVIERRTREIILALQQRDLRRLAAYVHPTRGVRFSPYLYVDTARELRFTRAQLPNLWRSRRVYRWGEMDETAEPIRLTFRRYFEQFVYDKDFAARAEVSYNTITNRGVSLNSLREAYPQEILVEYHVPPSDPQLGGDWASLWLIYDRVGSEWFLVGVAHNGPSI